jgi:putative ABC transport system ATP-binding protein
MTDPSRHARGAAPEAHADHPSRTGARTDAVAGGPPAARCRAVSVVLGSGETRVVALADVDLTVAGHEAVVLWGRSGSGKSTLLHVLAGLLAPTTGTVEFEDRPLDGRSDGNGATLRPGGIANVFQSPNLLPNFTVFENVAFAARAARNGDAGSGAAGSPLNALSLLRLVGLEGKADHLPAELSGGEAQRAAIARALAQRPRLLLCDEPTGHLDSDTAARVLSLIEALQREFGFALVLATHDADVAARFAHEVELLDGRVIREERHA